MFLYRLFREGPDRQDLCFRRLREENPHGSGIWALCIDVEDPTPAKVLILVEAHTDSRIIMDEINKAQTFFRQQLPSP